MRRARTAALLGAALVLLAVVAAHAQGPRALTAPAYPGNTLTIERKGPIVAGTIVRVQLSGHAHWDEPYDPFDSGYGLWLYVQDATVDPACEPWFGGQLQKAINIPVNATTASSGFVMQGELEVQREAPDQDVDWSTESAPFSVRPGVRKVMLCAYQRYVIDDAASYQLPVRVEQPSCRPRRAQVPRSGELTLNCNVSGRASVRFQGTESRTASVGLSAKNGKGKVSTKGLDPGRYRVTVKVGKLRLGKAFTVRVT